MVVYLVIANEVVVEACYQFDTANQAMRLYRYESIGNHVTVQKVNIHLDRLNPGGIIWILYRKYEQASIFNTEAQLVRHRVRRGRELNPTYYYEASTRTFKCRHPFAVDGFQVLHMKILESKSTYQLPPPPPPPLHFGGDDNDDSSDDDDVVDAGID